MFKITIYETEQKNNYLENKKLKEYTEKKCRKRKIEMVDCS